MGYRINLITGTLRIDAENKPNALEAIRDLMSREDELGHGHSPEGTHFSWLNRATPEEWETLGDAMADWRFPTIEDDEGNVLGVEFTGEKVGQEDLLFQAIAPCVEDGSSLLIRGEDGNLWQIVFEGNDVIENAIEIEEGHFNALYGME